MDSSLKLDRSRITSLDGLRGLAIILVVSFHAYARWPDLMPWTTTQSDFFKLGYLGVELFFLISGFVIYMTLEKCRSFGDFIFRRWLRLFPAMLVATVIIYTTSFLLTERPNGPIKFLDLFSGLLFIEDGILNSLQHYVHIITIEGAFWSLFVEVKFYLIFGILYFYNKKTAMRNLSLIFLSYFVYISIFRAAPSTMPAIIDKILTGLLSLQYFGWFCVGAMLYREFNSHNKSFSALSAVMMIPSILVIKDLNAEIAIACVALYLIFYLSLHNQWVVSVFSSRAFVFVGFISYPLYLIHENAMVALTIKTHTSLPFVPDAMTPWPGLMAIGLVAYLIAWQIEPQTKKLLFRVVKRH